MMTYNYNKISDRLKEIRGEKRLSQAKFGEIISVSQDTISLWETGKSLPNTEFIVQICLKFNVSANYLLGLED